MGAFLQKRIKETKSGNNLHLFVPFVASCSILRPADWSSAFSFGRALNAARFVHFQEMNFTVGAPGRSVGR